MPADSCSEPADCAKQITAHQPTNNPPPAPTDNQADTPIDCCARIDVSATNGVTATCSAATGITMAVPMAPGEPKAWTMSVAAKAGFTSTAPTNGQIAPGASRTCSAAAPYATSYRFGSAGSVEVSLPAPPEPATCASDSCSASIFYRTPRLAAGAGFTCIAPPAGPTQWCWGANYDGQLGDGTRVGRAEPTAVVGIGATSAAPAVAFFLGDGHACAILANNGGVKCWGANSFGQLVRPAAEVQLAPTLVPGIPSSANNVPTRPVALALADGLTCFLLQGGSVRCAGNNEDGQLVGVCMVMCWVGRLMKIGALVSVKHTTAA